MKGGRHRCFEDGPAKWLSGTVGKLFFSIWAMGKGAKFAWAVLHKIAVFDGHG